MDIFKECIKMWLTNHGRISIPDPFDKEPYYGFITEYEQYYSKTAEKTPKEFSAEDIKKAVYFDENNYYATDINIMPEHISVKYSGFSWWFYVKNLVIGYEAHIKGNEFTFDIVIDNGEIFKAPVNDILNEYLGEAAFTRGIIINSFEELGSIFKTMFRGCVCLAHFVDNYSCPEYCYFITQTDFLDEYEKMNLECHRSNDYKTIADKKTVMGMLKQYEGITVKYFTGERFFRITKTVGEMNIGYHAIIRQTLITLFFLGSCNEKPLFGSAGIEWVIKDVKGIKLHSVQFQSVEELKGILDFMQKYLDILAGLFEK